MARLHYHCVVCGNIRIPFTIIGGGCICRCCERELLNSSPEQPAYLRRARQVGNCFSQEIQRLLRGD